MESPLLAISKSDTDYSFELESAGKRDRLQRDVIHAWKPGRGFVPQCPFRNRGSSRLYSIRHCRVARRPSRDLAVLMRDQRGS